MIPPNQRGGDRHEHCDRQRHASIPVRTRLGEAAAGWSFGSSAREGRPPRTCVRGAATPDGDVLVLARSTHPVMVFDREGQFVTSWGEGCFSGFVHGLTLDAAGHVWIADSGQHEVTEHSPQANCCAVSATASSRRRPGTVAHSTCRPGSLSPPLVTSMSLTATATGACIDSA